MCRLLRYFPCIGLHFNALQYCLSDFGYSNSFYHLCCSPSIVRHLHCHQQVTFPGLNSLPVLLNQLSRMTFKRGHSLSVNEMRIGGQQKQPTQKE